MISRLLNGEQDCELSIDGGFPMKVQTIGIDFGKKTLHLIGMDERAM